MFRPDIDRDMLVQDSVDEAVGLGPLERLMTDPLISEIMVNSATDIFVERKGKLQQVPLAFSDDDSSCPYSFQNHIHRFENAAKVV